MKTNPATRTYFMWTLLLVGLVVLIQPYMAVAAEGQVLAKVGNRAVTEDDLKQLANAVPESVRHLYLTPEGKKKALEYIVNVYALAEEARNQGLDKTPDVLRLMEFSQQDLLARLYLDRISKNLPEPTEQEARAYFEKNKAQYSTPEAIHLRHILVPTEADAKKVLDRLKKGEKFAGLAKKVSICPTKGWGGDLDWQFKGNQLPEIEKVAFSMDEGQIAGPVKTKFGYHILLLEGKRPAQEAEFDQVKDYVIEQLKSRKRQEFYEKVAKKLRKKMNVQISAPSEPTAAPATKPAAPVAGPKN